MKSQVCPVLSAGVAAAARQDTLLGLLLIPCQSHVIEKPQGLSDGILG